MNFCTRMREGNNLRRAESYARRLERLGLKTGRTPKRENNRCGARWINKYTKKITHKFYTDMRERNNLRWFEGYVERLKRRIKDREDTKERK